MKSSWIITALFLSGCTVTQVNQMTNAVVQADKLFTEVAAVATPTNTEVADGLREALIQGISKGTDQVSKIDGYFANPQIKIPFPPDVKKVETRLRQLGMDKEVDRVILTLNRGAEDAAAQAKPIFIDAIRQMTIQDAWGILKGQPDAATQFLRRTTTAALRAKFIPVIQASLNKTEATRFYGDVINSYNKIPLVEKVNPDLTGYVTDLAIQGLFVLVAQEEQNIRANPVARTTDLMKRVFAAQK